MDQLPKFQDAMSVLQGDLISKAIMTVAIIIILSILRSISLKLIAKYAKSPRIKFNARKITLNITFIFGLLWVFSVWVSESQSLLTFLGLMSAGVAVALKDPIVNIFGWIFILWRHPFKAGDRIQIGDNAGDVIDIRLFQFSIMEIGNWVNADQYTGRIVNIPNSNIFSMQHSLYSNDFDLLWDELNITITFESDYKKAKDLLEKILDDYNNLLTDKMKSNLEDIIAKYNLENTNFNTGIYTELLDQGINFVLRFNFIYNERRKAKHEIIEKVIAEFQKHADVDFAYPTTRFYSNITEGKQSKSNTD